MRIERQRRDARSIAWRGDVVTPIAPSDRAGLYDLPPTVIIGAFWIVLVDIPRLVQLGPISLSGAFTVLLAFLIVCLLPSYASNGEARTRSMTRAQAARTRIPLLLWIFLLFVSISFVFWAISGNFTPEAIQNECLYICFVGAIALATTTRSKSAVLRGWDLVRVVSTWFAYIALIIAIMERGSAVTGNRLLGFLFTPRPMAIVALIALAIVIPGTPRNTWMKFAPYAIVAAIALSLSRTGTVIGLALLTFLVLRDRHAARRKPGERPLKAMLILASIVVSAYLLIVYYAPFRDRFLVGDNALKFRGLAISTQGRAQVWEVVLSNSSDNWLLGHGAGAASRLVDSHFPGLDHPHNEYLRLFFDFGLVGLFLFVAGYLLLVWRTYSNARHTGHPLHWAAFISLVGILLMAVTDNPFVYPFVMVPLGSLAGLSLALARFELSEYCADRDNEKHALGQQRLDAAR